MTMLIPLLHVFLIYLKDFSNHLSLALIGQYLHLAKQMFDISLPRYAYTFFEILLGDLDLVFGEGLLFLTGETDFSRRIDSSFCFNSSFSLSSS